MIKNEVEFENEKSKEMVEEKNFHFAPLEGRI